MEQTFFLKGVVPSQKNAKTIAYNSKTGKPFIMSSKKVREWQEEAGDILDLLEIAKYECPVKIDFTFYHKDKRQKDLDNEITSCLDLLKKHRIISDDNCFVVQELTGRFGGVRRDNYGVEIKITPIDT